jgi:hypothetical protein
MLYNIFDLIWTKDILLKKIDIRVFHSIALIHISNFPRSSPGYLYKNKTRGFYTIIVTIYNVLLCSVSVVFYSCELP